MGVSLTVYRSGEEPGAAISDFLGATVINVAGPDRASDWAPGVWLASHGDGAALVPVVDGVLKWGEPSGNFAGAPGDPTWLAAARRVSGGALVEVFDAEAAVGLPEVEPELPPAWAPRTASAIAEEVRNHLTSNLRAHGETDTSVLVGGAVAGLARFVAEQQGHAAVRTMALGLADEAEKLILRDAPAASEVRQ